jgi:hypothetical protein
MGVLQMMSCVLKYDVLMVCTTISKSSVKFVKLLNATSYVTNAKMIAVGCSFVADAATTIVAGLPARGARSTPLVVGVLKEQGKQRA